MTTLADMQFAELQPGMKFEHPEHGEQVVLDISRGQLGPVIRFHDSRVYDGEMPQMREEQEEEEISIFQKIAHNTYPHSAEQWQYLGTVDQEEIAAHGWQWFQLDCPHCGLAHRLLAADPPAGARQCRVCGMSFSRPARPVNS
jgi:hypothetical protein